jgi:transketolase
MGIEPVARKWEAFGWHAEEVDGNSIPALLAAFDACRQIADRPQVLVCYTKLGNGVPLIEDRAKGHFVRIEPQEWDEAFRQLEVSA